MDCGAVQRVFSLFDPQKSGGLLEGLLSKAGDIQERLPGAKRTLLLPVFDDLPGHGLIYPRHIPEKGKGCRIQVYPDPVYARLHRAIKSPFESLLVHVMLVLADADGL